MERVMVFRSYRDSARLLARESTESALEYLMAVLDYGLDDEEPNFTSCTAEAMFVLTRPTLESSKKRAMAGAAGGRASGRHAVATAVERETEPERTQGTAKRVDYEAVVKLYHDTCKSYPEVKKISEGRKKAISARLKEYSTEELRDCFQLAEESSFLKGGNDRNWTADFDWLMKSQNMAKVLEGKYNDKKTRTETPAIAQPTADDFARSRAQLVALREELG